MRRMRICLWCILALLFLQIATMGAENESVTIRNVEGRGANRQLALADAFRNAIGQALGTYVVTSRTWDGETLDKKIFDNSDAIVKTHRIVSENETGGKTIIVIDAEIVRNEMMKYIHRETTTKVEEGELANMLAKRTAINNAIQSLELLFQNWRENVYRVEKYGDISVAADDKTGSDTVQLSIPFIVTFHWDAYYLFLGKVRNVLSRIAIDKTQGEYAQKRDEDFRKKNFAFYNGVGLLKKDSYGNDKVSNPNGYGEVRILSWVSEEVVRYEIYIVPNQLKKALDRLLVTPAEFRFSFTSKGGELIARQSISGDNVKVYSSCWSWFCYWELSGKSDFLKDTWDASGTVTLEDQIIVDFRNDSHLSTYNLYHASIPVPFDKAQRIAGCSIVIRDPQKENNDLSGRVVTKEEMNRDEWTRIDRKPSQKFVTRNNPSNAAHEKRHLSMREESEIKSEKGHVVEFQTIISEKDKMLKDKILQLCNLPPNIDTARKWFALSKEVESADLQQMVYKLTGAALVCDKKGEIYRSKIRNRIKGATDYEASWYIKCPDCEGKKTKERKCSACSGIRGCKSCRGSGLRKVYAFRTDGGDHFEACRTCHGTGICSKCKGRGVESVQCRHCNDKGCVFRLSAVSQNYRQLIGQILIYLH